MNLLNLFLRGAIIGFSIAAPVGPIGVLCIRRTLAEGRLIGFLSGLGAATADMLYGAIAAFGLAFVTDLLVGQATWLRLFGGLFLIYLGVRAFIAKPSESPQPSAAANAKLNAFGAYLSTFLLTMTNPMTILSFVGIFAALRLGDTNSSYLSAAFMVLGVFLGSAAWWLGLSFSVGLLREKFAPQWTIWVNRISGLIVAGFGIFALVS